MTGQCTHKRAGIVTNQPGKYQDYQAHASADVCRRKDCVTAAVAWVRRKTGQQGFFVSDEELLARAKSMGGAP